MALSNEERDQRIKDVADELDRVIEAGLRLQEEARDKLNELTTILTADHQEPATDAHRG